MPAAFDARGIRLRCVVSGVIALAGLSPGAAFALDPSKITASCFVSNSPRGPFSATDPVTLLTQSDLIVLLFYRNQDTAADAVYTANFTASILTSGAFGLGRVIDTKEVVGGGGLGTGRDSLIRVRAGDSTATQAIVIRVTSDITGTAVLARCDFILTPVEMSDDIDGDGLTNDVERFGLLDPATGTLLLGADGQPIADFPTLGANPCRKDLAVEVDYQTGANHSHRPVAAAVDEVQQAFADAPVLGSPGCPFDGFESEPGIKLHMVFDDEVAEGTTTDAEGRTTINPSGCADSSHFELARRGLFRRNRWVHTIDGSSTSGLSPCGDGSILVSLGLWGGPGQNGSAREQSGTFMHELGHALGLGHGGDSGINLKPNYLSVMNYSFQFGIPEASGASRIDYSRELLPELDEGALDEHAGLRGPANLRTIWWGPHPKFVYQTASQSGPAQGALDWNGSGGFESSVSADVNSDGVCTWPGPNQLRETDPEGDDVVASNMIFNGPDLVCDTRPCNRGAACDDMLTVVACVWPGANGVLDTMPALDDVSGGGQIVAGPNAVCDTSAAFDDLQMTPVGRSELRVLGHEDWSQVLRAMASAGSGVSMPPQANWTLEEARAVAHSGEPRHEFDLDVSTQSIPGAAQPGDEVSYRVTVANVGVATATAVRLLHRNPDATSEERSLRDLAPGESVVEIFRHVVACPSARVVTLADSSSVTGLGPGGERETVTLNNSASASTVVTDPPPVVQCPATQVSECTGHMGTAVVFAPPSATDSCDPTPAVSCSPASGHGFPLGTTAVACTATDSLGGSAVCSFDVSIVDTTPPSLGLSASPLVLWPPDHKLVPVTVTATPQDSCDASPALRLLSIVSSEPDTADPDVQGASLGTDDRHVLLRAERSGSGPGRRYTLLYSATDSSGNVVTASTEVTVPHDRR